ncbi:MAG: helix-turn-helix transcriptional regulator [Oscillospiraceae bacterium]
MKNDPKSLVSIREYGHIKVKLADMMHARKITRNKLSTLIGVKYDVIDRYYKAENIVMVDLDLFAKICCVLECKIQDILEYETV